MGKHIQYLIRLDDACPTMNHEKWSRIETLLDKYGVKPMAGIIPNNEDPKQQVGIADESFWRHVKEWEVKGWSIALHGYNHCYTSQGGMNGLNPMWAKSEFAGFTIEEQREKIRKGMTVLREHGINPKYFFAPSHTFDDNTLAALREESDIRIISDTIATKPYRYKDFVFIPQFSGQCREMRMSGVFTFCFHPNTMNDKAFEDLDKFLYVHNKGFISFADLDLNNVKDKSFFDRLLSFGYFTIRRLRGLK